MLQDLEENYKLFKDGHEQLLAMVRNESLLHLKENKFYICHDNYISVKSYLLDLLFDFESPETPTVHESTYAASSCNDSFTPFSRLPKIDLYTFTVGYLEWISYRDMFMSLVYQNNALSKIQKYFAVGHHSTW